MSNTEIVAGGAVNSALKSTARLVRGLAAIALAVPIVGVTASPALVGATTTLVPQTAWEVDGNSLVDGNGGVPSVSVAGDWGNDAGTSWSGGIYGPGSTPGGLASTGSYYLWRDMDACNSLTDTIAVGGDKVDDGPAWPVITGSAPNKADVKSVSLAAEKVNVGGQVNDIVYAAFELCQDSGGSFNATLYFDDGDGIPPVDASTGNNLDLNGDFLILFDFKSAQVGEGSLFKRVAGAWVFQTKDATKIETYASGVMGEAAVNLTTLGILPGTPGPGGTPSACRQVSIGGQVASVAGYSTGSQVKDLVGVTPLDVSNCGPLKVTKASNATDSTTEFGYDVVQADNQPSHDSTLAVTGGAVTTEPDATVNEIDATINVGETHTWTNVISQPDYKITEDTPPTGWALQTISCTYPNIFAAPSGGVYPTATATIYTAGAYTAQTFLVPPSFIDLSGSGSPTTLPAAHCTITNNVTGIKVVKTGAGDPSTLFHFADNSGSPKTADLPIADDPGTTPVENATTFLYGAGQSVTITETLPASTPAWQNTAIACARPDGSPVGTTDLGAHSASVTTVAGEVITCTFTNNQKARLVVAKTGSPAGSTQQFPFEQNWDGENTEASPDFTLTIGSNTSSGDLAPGTYTVKELLPAATPAWVLSNIVCVDDSAGSNGSSDDTSASPTVSVTLAAGDMVTCTYTNDQVGRIVIVKNTEGGNGSFSFATSPSVPGLASVSTVGGSGSAASDVAPGTYSISETVPAGWDLTGSECDDGSSVGAVQVAAGETVTCTFTNVKRGEITVSKQTLPDGSLQEFGFDASWDGNTDGAADLTLQDNDPATSSGGLVPGSYTVTELAQAGWDLTGLACTSSVTGNNVLSVATSTATIQLEAGELVECTFSNTQRGEIKVVKQTLPDGSLQEFGFDASWDGNTDGAADLTLHDNDPAASSGLVTPGTYSVAELAVAGWDLSSATCDDGSTVDNIQLAPGEVVTCTFNNTQRGNIRIVKNSGIAGGTFDFTGSWLDPTGFSILTAGPAPYMGEAYTANVAPGTYTVAESAETGFDLKSLVCVETRSVGSADGGSSPSAATQTTTGTIDLDPGETVTCTFNNTKQGTIVVEKQTVPTPMPDDFEFSGDMGSFTLDDDGDEGNTHASSATFTGVTATSVNGDTYTVAEAEVPGWALTSLTCSDGGAGQTGSLASRSIDIVVPDGGTVVCVFVNTAIAPTLTIDKTAIGGDATFEFPVSGLASSPLSITTASGTGSVGPVDLAAGQTYSVSETDAAEWVEGAMSCFVTPAGSTTEVAVGTLSFTALPGAAYRCEITNTKRGRIIVDKVTVPSTDTTEFGFNASWDAGADPDFSLAHGTAAFDTGFTLVPNQTYTVTEPATDGWKLTALVCDGGSTTSLGSGTASIDLAPGETVTCTYTNSRRGPVTVVKTVTSGPTAVVGQPEQWDVEYELEISSASYIDEQFDLIDTIAPGGASMVVSASASTLAAITLEPAWNGTTNLDLAIDETIAAQGTIVVTVTVRFEVPGTTTSSERDCELTSGEVGTGTLNTAVVSSQGASDSGKDCAEIPDPDIIVEKSIVETPVRNPDGTFTIVYGIDVTNAAGAGNGEYTLTDTFGFGAGIVALSKSVTESPAGVTINPDYSIPPGDNVIADDVVMGPGLLVHHFEVTVTVSVAPGLGTDGDCDAGDPATGLLNTASITVPGYGPVDPSSVCEPVSTLTLVKSVVNDDGGDLEASEVTLTAAQNAATVFSGVGPSVGSGVMAGDYDLSESTVPGYAASAWSCPGATVDSASVTVPAGTNVVCTITNDDIAPTITVVKVVQNLHGGTAVAGDFSLTVDGDAATQNVAIEVTANAPHSVSEAAKAGYEWVSTTCVDGADTPIEHPVTLAEGGTATCTVTNRDISPRIKLIKNVVNDNGGDADAADFSLTLEGDVVAQGTWIDVDANSPISIDELALGGYLATGVECESDLGRDDSAANTAEISVTPALDEDITCTITNTDVPPGLTVVKTVVNDDGGNAVVADFVLRVNGNAVTSGVLGVYDANTLLAITEEQIAGYVATGTECTSNIPGSDNAGTFAGGGTSVTLAAGEAVVCTITNDDVAPTISVVKVVVNDDGGDAVVGDFDLLLDGSSVESGVASTVMANVEYSVSEVSLAGYVQTSLVCVDGEGAEVSHPVVPDEGDEITCTITNDDVAPTISVVKVVVNDDGGDAVVGDFDLLLDGSSVESGVASTVMANVEYSVSEVSLAGYVQTSLVCVDGEGAEVSHPVVPDEGDEITCTITNDDVAPTISVVKVVVNDDGGDAVVGDFDLLLDGSSVESGVASTVMANVEYSVSEVSLAGYVQTSLVCVDGEGAEVSHPVVPDEGDEITCTITNDDVAPTISVVKVVVNDDGGDAVVGDFDLFIGTDPAGSGVEYVVDANEPYEVGEDDLAGYEQVSLECVDAEGAEVENPVVPDEGDEITCTITNDDIAPTLTVKKIVVNDAGGDLVATDFQLTVDGGNRAQDLTVDVPAGVSLIVSELPVAGYVPTGVACTSSLGRDDSLTDTATIAVTPALDEDIVCTITNSDVAPGLTVVKSVVNDNGGNAEPGDFGLQVNGGTVTTGVLTVQTAHTDLVVGELQFPGYIATGTVCVSDIDGSGNSLSTLNGTATVNLEPGESVVCTITNDDQPVDLEIDKDDAGAQPKPGETFTYTLTVSNGGARDADLDEPVVVTDELPVGLSWGAPLPAECSAVGQTLTCNLDPADLGVGESVVLTVPVVVDEDAPSQTYTNVAWVDTEDDPVCTDGDDCVPPPACPGDVQGLSALSDPTNNVDCEDTPVQELADLAIVKTNTNGTPQVGSSFDWVLTVTNHGPDVAEDVEVTDVVPASLTVTGVTSSDFDCLASGNAVSCTRPTLAVGATGVIRITVLVPNGTPVGVAIVNTGEVTGSVEDPDLSNNISNSSVIPRNPDVEAPTTTRPGTIPETGGDAGDGLMAGLLLLLAGVATMLVARRRRPT